MYVLFGVMVLQVYTFVKTHQSVSYTSLSEQINNTLLNYTSYFKVKIEGRVRVILGKCIFPITSLTQTFFSAYMVP